MGTEVKIWQIVDGKLQDVNTSLKKEKKTEPYDLEPWIASNPEIIGPNIVIIGRQVPTKSGAMDLLGIDKSGNLIVIEIKRDKLPREVIAQAIDYASDIAAWTTDKVSEVCSGYTSKNLEELIGESFPDIEIENFNINDTQRIVLVGFSIESSLERMIEWLSNNFNVNINAVILNYVKTSSNEELLAKTSIISDEREQEIIKKKRKFQIPMSDEPGNYDIDSLKKLLTEYLSIHKIGNQRIKDVLFPALLKHKKLSRLQLKQELIKFDTSIDPAKAGYYLTGISMQLGLKKNDFLRQLISYEYPTYSWEKDNFSLNDDYKDLVKEVLEELKRAL